MTFDILNSHEIVLELNINNFYMYLLILHQIYKLKHKNV